MNITGAYLDKLGGTQLTKTESNVKDNSFEKMLDTASSKADVKISHNETKTAERKSNSKKADNKNNDQRSQQTGNNSVKKDVEATDNAAKVNEGTKTETKATESTTETEDNIKVESDKKLGEEIMTEVADALNIPKELLAQILEQLNITPVELTDKAKLSSVIQAVHGAESPVELLNIPDIKNEFEAAENAIKTAYENVELNSQVSEEEVKTQNIKQTVAAQTVAAQTEKPVEAVKLTNDFEITDGKEIADTTQTAVKTEVKTTQANTDAQNQNLTGNGQSTSSDMFANAEVEGNFAANQTFNVESVDVHNIEKAVAVKNASPTEIMNQIIEKVKVDVKNGVTEVKMVLKPENLGDITLKVATQNGIVTAQFIAENERVKEIIESNFEMLKDALGEQGINVSELSVSVSQGETQQQMQEFLEGRAKSQSRISSIINGIEAEMAAEESAQADEKEIYKNNVNYVI